MASLGSLAPMATQWLSRGSPSAGRCNSGRDLLCCSEALPQLSAHSKLLCPTPPEPTPPHPQEIITIAKDKLPGYEEKIKMFYEEHIHSDEEIRYILDGSGGLRGSAGAGVAGRCCWGPG